MSQSSYTGQGAGRIDEFFAVIARETPWRKPGHLRHNLGYLFKGVAFAGQSMLEIGGGIGVFSFYAACAGATKVVCLEPEAAGSSAGVQNKFQRLGELLKAGQVTLLGTTFQEYEPGDTKFDTVLSHNSINHLDEEACILLHRDARARETYRSLFRKMYEMMNPGGRLILADCSGYNVFAQLGMRNPFRPTVEWHKHQSPRLWAEVAGEAGFRRARTRWKSLSPMGAVGQALLGNRLAAFFLISHFCLTMERP